MAEPGLRTHAGGAAGRVAIGVVLVLSAGVAALASAWPGAHLAVLAILASVVMALPTVRYAEFNPCTTWSLMAASVFVGVTLRGLYIAFEYPSPDVIRPLFLLGMDPDSFFWPTALLVTGLGLLSFGYFTRRARSTQPGSLGDRFEGWDPHRLEVSVAVCVVVSVAAFVAYLLWTGGPVSDQLTAKRTVIPGLEGSVLEDYRGFGYLRTLNRFGQVAFLLTVAHVGWVGRPMKARHALVLGGLFVNAAAMPFYASQRAEIAWLVLLGLAVWWYAGRRIRWGLVLPIVAACLLLVQAMTALRGVPDVSGDDLISTLEPARALDPLVLTLNFVDMSKTAHIIAAVPDELDYQMGRTVLPWLVAPIPRELWNAKPLITHGPLIGVVLFGTQVAGVPPGFVAEMYWNFGPGGVLVGCWALGVVLGRLDRFFRPTRGRDPARTLVYVAGIIPLGFTILGDELGQGLFNGLLDTFQMILPLAYICRPTRVPAAQFTPRM